MQSYPYNISQFPDSKVNLDNLNFEIRSSSISVSLYSINSANNVVDIIFNAVLGEKDNNTLDNIVATHDNIAKNNAVMNVNIIPENIKFFEAGDVTNDMYRAESWVLDIPADASTHAFYFYKPYNISLLSAEIDAIDDMIGDELTVTIAPDTVVGALTSAATVGDVSINVSPTVTANLIPGRYISTTSDEYHEVITVDTTNNIIEFDKPLATDSNPGSYVFMSVPLISHLYFYTNQHVEIGKSISTGQRMPAYVPIRVLYTNNTNIAKKVAFFIEYLY